MAQVERVRSIVEERKTEQMKVTAAMEPEVASIMAPMQTVAIMKLAACWDDGDCGSLLSAWPHSRI
eukprot:6492407-Amphidinium_carterae.2